MNVGAGGSATPSRAASAAVLFFDSGSADFSSTTADTGTSTFASISGCVIGSGTTDAASAFRSAGAFATTVSALELGAAGVVRVAAVELAVFAPAASSFGFFFSQSRQSLRPSETGKPHASHLRTCDTAIRDRPSADAGLATSTFVLIDSGCAGFTGAADAGALGASSTLVPGEVVFGGSSRAGATAAPPLVTAAVARAAEPAAISSWLATPVGSEIGRA